jgi:hydroxypyruvate isomerase
MGERGLACLPRRELEFRSSIDQALDYAGELGCPTLHVMAGNPVAGEPVAEALARYVDNLHFAVERVAGAGRNAVIEPLNRIDMPGYLLNSTTASAAIIEQIGHPHLGLLFDFYHVQRMEGELTRSFQTLMPRILHVQIAGVPDRHEPSPSEIDPAYLLRLIDALGYAGWVGCEYHPRDGTRNGLGWADAFIST